MLHEGRLWGYPIALETVTLIYNRVLLDGPPPTDLSQLASVSQDIRSKHPGVIPILWDSRSPFYTWGSWLATETMSLPRSAPTTI